MRPWERDLGSRTRWSNPVPSGGGCAVRSPMLPLTWTRADRIISFDGGAALVLTATDSGISASIVLEAAQAAAPAQENGQTIAESSQLTAIADVAEDAAAMPQRRLELSGNIAGHAILADGQSPFFVDSMDDPTHMRFGYRQTSVMLRAFKRSATLKLQLTLRSPEVQIFSAPLELNGLEAAARTVERCANRAPAR
jgi:hypothetical protein